MKTKILSMLAMAAMLLTTSCAKDEANEPASGEQVTASFNVQLPTGINARQAKGPKKVYADGTTAKTLKYMVFDASGKRVAGVGGEKAINLTTTVQLQLTTGKEYQIVFWAANANAPYTLDDAGKVTINYEGMKANDESLDAFYRCYKYKAGADVENPIKLYRPFAQLNVGTKDMAEAEKTGFSKAAAKTKVTVSGIGNELNLLTGVVSGDATVTCDLNAIPTGETFPKEGYDYLSMDYLLVGKESKTTVDVDWEITDGANTIDRTFANVPLQGNYRTNIYGSLLTSTSDFNVEIDPAFNEPANEVEVDFDKVYEVSTKEALEAALEDQTNKSILIKLSGKVEYSSFDNKKVGGDNTKLIVIRGVTDDAEFNQTCVDPNYGWPRFAVENKNAKVKFENLKYTNDDKVSGTWDSYDINFWNSLDWEFVNVTFNKAVAFATPGINATMKNCVITDPDERGNYALWIVAGANVTLDGCAISGNRAVKVADQYVTNPTATILNCNNCKFTSSKKAAVYSSTVGGGKLTFTGTNDITGVQADTENHVWIDPGYESTKDKITVVGAKVIVKG